MYNDTELTAVESGQRRQSLGTTSTATEAHQGPAKASKGGIGKPPIRIPIYIGRSLVLLISLGVFILNIIARDDNGVRAILVSVVIAVLCFLWSCVAIAGLKFRPSFFSPTRFFFLRFLVDLALAIGSFVCFGLFFGWNGDNSVDITYSGAYLGLLVILGGLEAVIAMLVCIQKIQSKQPQQPHKFMQPMGATGAPPATVTAGADFNAGMAAVSTTTDRSRV